jgi:hypothetical protein
MYLHFYLLKNRLERFFVDTFEQQKKGLQTEKNDTLNTKQKNLNLKFEVGQRDKWRKQIDRWK